MPNNDRTVSYNCVYYPSIEGQYKVTIKFAAKEIPKSPYLVQVTGKLGDAGKVTAQGPGIEPVGVKVKKKTYFEVITKGEYARVCKQCCKCGGTQVDGRPPTYF